MIQINTSWGRGANYQWSRAQTRLDRDHGLGLSISHDINVKQHGGSIDVETQPDEFTENRVILPRAAVLIAERA